MARIRSIKPEFWTSEQILKCSASARLLFIGLWNFCDDFGRHPFSARQVKAEVFPSDSLSEKTVMKLLQELSSNGLISIYRAGNKDYFYVTGWHHQRIDKPQPAKYPDPLAEDSEIAPGTFPPDKIREDKKGKDTKGNDPNFEEFWKCYPTREGSNPKATALLSFKKAVDAGHDAQAIIAGARGYSAECDRGKIERKYVVHAVTWLNQSRWADYPALPDFTGPKTIFVDDDTPGGKAWTAYERATRGLLGPRHNGGWYRETEYPPEIQSEAAPLNMENGNAS